MNNPDIETYIHGVRKKTLQTFPDDRGFFREILRYNEDVFSEGQFAQWSHSKMSKNVVKAWHFHHRQTDWWYLALGTIEAVLYDYRSESPTHGQKMQLILSGEDSSSSNLIRIPPGVLHGLKVLSATAHLLYITSQIYDPEDEGRIPYNDPAIPHEWGEDVITVPRDRILHIPSYERAPIVG